MYIVQCTVYTINTSYKFLNIKYIARSLVASEDQIGNYRKKLIVALILQYSIRKYFYLPEASFRINCNNLFATYDAA